MSRRITSAQVILSLHALLLLGCEPRPPARPSGVPASAIWWGGPDGGMWYDCTDDVASSSNKCSIFFDPGGDLLITARYRLQDSQTLVKKDEFRKLTVGGRPWGSIIYIEGGKELHAIDIEFYNKDVK